MWAMIVLASLSQHGYAFDAFSRQQQMERDAHQMEGNQLARLLLQLLAGSSRSIISRNARARADPSMGFFDFLNKGKVKASHILLKAGGPDPIGSANLIIRSIENGETTFEQAAQKYSSCPSGQKGGDLGFFGQGAMVPEFDKYCFDPNTNIGDMGIVKTNFGTHIVKLTERP